MPICLRVCVELLLRRCFTWDFTDFMLPTENSNQLVYVARQVILDRNREIFGYELLFRNAQAQSCRIDDDLFATTNVIHSTLNAIGIKKMVGDRMAFINVNEEFIHERVYEALDPAKFILEILETTEVTSELLEGLQETREQGFVIALDDFVFDDRMKSTFQQVLPFVSILKVELVNCDFEVLEDELKKLKQYGFRFLAEKVETEEEFEICKRLGFDFFQGYFFAKPEIVEGKKIQPQSMALLDLVQLVRKQTELEELERAFKKYPDVTLNLLKFLNSAFYAFHSKIESVRHAITLIGPKKLQGWLMLLLYSSKEDQSTASQPVLQLAVQRASLMEKLAESKWGDTDFSQKAFLAGVLSLLDVVFQVPLSKLVDEFEVDPMIRDAILEKSGVLGKLLRLANAAERDELSEVTQIAKEIGMNLKEVCTQITDCYLHLE